MTATLADAPRSAIARLLRPGSIALAGVSASPGSLGGIVLDNLERFAFAGAIHLIHPRQSEVRGRPCVATPAELPFGVDCVVLAVPAAAVLDAVRACAANGVGGIVIFAAGFAELGDAGASLQDEVARIARDAGMAIEGPNCLGYVNYVDAIPLTFAVTTPQPLGSRGVAVAAQSGALASVVRAALQARGLDVSFAVSSGNEAANGLEDFVAFLLDEPTTHVVAIVAEHIRAPQRFLALARRARSRGIAMVMLHPGRSRAAAAAARTHTGAMTGDHVIMTTQVVRYGVDIVETLEELIDHTDILMRCGVRPRDGVAVLGESGAYKALVLDYADRLAIDLPQPEGAARRALDAIAPGFIIASNPLDLTAQALGDPGLYARAIEGLLDNPQCGSLLVTIILTSAELAERKMPPVIAAMRAATASHAVVFAMLGEDVAIPGRIVDEVRAAGIPFFRSPERALRALAGVSAIPAAAPAAETIADAAPLPSGTMPEHRAKNVLAQAGVPISPGRLVETMADASAAAEVVGYPVALKVQSSALSHKSEVGGVQLHLGDRDALAAGWAQLHADVAALAPDARLDGVLVEHMAPAGLEMIIGARADPDWGAVIVIGLGGVTAEALGDVRVIPADLDEAGIAAEVRRLKGSALLGPFRGRPARDVAALAATVATVGKFVLAHPEIVELDINPLVVLAAGEGAVALDALIVCR